MTDQQTPAGWYPHPGMQGTLGYWDGERWTEQVAPATAAAERSGPSAFTIARGVALGIAVVLAALFFLNRVAASDDDLDCATENVQRAQDGRPAVECD